MSIHGKKILIVDDVADQRMLARRVLENVGLIVIEADSVENAFITVPSESPHLVLLDLQMPDVTGFTFLEQKSKYPALASVPIVVTSGLQDKDSIYKAISLGASDYVIKPIRANLLLQKVRKHLKDAEFQNFQFKKMPEVKIGIGVQITKLSPTNFFLDSPIKIASDAKIQLQGEKLEGLGLADCLFVTDSTPFVRAVSGQYSGKVNAVGLKKTILSKSKKAST